MLLKLEIPPGVVRKGTEYQSAGRFYDTNLVRWREGSLRPVGGWDARSQNAVSGMARGMLVWRDGSNNAWIGIGTHTGLYVQDRGGNLYNITPSSFTAGRPDAVTGGGYGGGPYGSGTYGTPRPDTTQILDATTWSLDSWGPDLVGVSTEDNNIVQWNLNTSTSAAMITNSPSAAAIVVTADHMIMALAANNDPRRVAWCDQADNTIWTGAANNTAGGEDLQTNGRLMCGCLIQAGTLLWTDVDVWLATNLQNVDVYGFIRVGDGCGIISRHAAVAVNIQAFWMGERGFYTYNGFTVQPLPCDVSEYVFGNMNTLQASKVFAWHNADFDEIWWFFPSAASTEIDSYVAWSYKEGHWTVGQLVRTAGSDREVLLNPLLIGTNGIVYEHETGLIWNGAMPYARSGPLTLGDGDKVMMARQLWPDDKTLGDVSASFYTRLYTDDAPTVVGPITLSSSRTDVRFTARYVEVLYQATGPNDFRVGTPTLEVVAGGLR